MGTMEKWRHYEAFWTPSDGLLERIGPVRKEGAENSSIFIFLSFKIDLGLINMPKNYVKALWVVSGLSISTLSSAGSVNVVMILGAKNQEANHIRFRNEFKFAVQVMESLNSPSSSTTNTYSKTIIAADGGDEWKVFSKKGNRTVSKPKIDSPFYSKTDVENIFDSNEFKNKNSTLIIMSGHGKKPTDIGQYDSVSVGAWRRPPEKNERLSLQDLKGIIAGANLGHKVRITCNICYSGGIHDLARELPNVCSVATTNYLMSSKTKSTKSEFNRGFWDYMHDPKNTNPIFAEAAISGLKNDSKNLHFGQLSSFDYIDFLFQRGPYHPDIDEIAHNGKIELESDGELDEHVFQIFGQNDPMHPSLKHIEDPLFMPDRRPIVTSVATEVIIKPLSHVDSSRPDSHKQIEASKKLVISQIEDTLRNLEQHKGMQRKLMELLRKDFDAFKLEYFGNKDPQIVVDITNYTNSITKIADELRQLKNNRKKTAELKRKISTLTKKQKRKELSIQDSMALTSAMKDRKQRELDTELYKQKVNDAYEILDKVKKRELFKHIPTISRISDLSKVLLGKDVLGAPFNDPRVTQKEREKLANLLDCEWSEF